MSTQSAPRVAVVGGGISGIAAAYYLQLRGARVDLFEAEATLGGRMATATLNGREISLGGKNIGMNYALFREFVRDINNQQFEHFGLNSSRIEDGRIKTFDGSRRLQGMLGFLRGATPRDIYRLLRLMQAVRRDRSEGDLGGPRLQRLHRRWGASRLTEAFSPGFAERFTRPLVLRMNGAEPAEVPVANFGTNLCTALDSYEQLREGVGPLLHDFAQRVTVHTQAPVVQLQRADDGAATGVVIARHGSQERWQFDHVVLATPAPVSARVLLPHAPAVAELLQHVRYYPVGIVVADYDRDVFSRDVRALVFPADSPLSNAGAYGIDDRNRVRYTFSGRRARELLASAPSVERLVLEGERALDPYIPVRDKQRLGFAGKVLTTGLCAYAEDFSGFAEALAREVSLLPGLSLTGDYLAGASLENCFRAAKRCVDGIDLAAAQPPAPTLAQAAA